MVANRLTSFSRPMGIRASFAKHSEDCVIGMILVEIRPEDASRVSVLETLEQLSRVAQRDVILDRQHGSVVDVNSRCPCR